MCEKDSVCVKEGVCVCVRERKCVCDKGEQGRVMRSLCVCASCEACVCACVKEKTCVNVCECMCVTSATRYAPFETCARCV